MFTTIKIIIDVIIKIASCNNNNNKNNQGNDNNVKNENNNNSNNNCRNNNNMLSIYYVFPTLTLSMAFHFGQHIGPNIT